MKYLPKGMRLRRTGIDIHTVGADYRDKYPIMDFHGAFGKYELEDEFAEIIVSTFNAFAALSEATSPDYAGLLAYYKEQEQILAKLRKRKKVGA